MRRRNWLRQTRAIAIAVLCLCAVHLAGCVKVPAGLVPVSPFDVQRYSGTWYEIARFEHSFERGLEQVTARYSIRADGSIEVVNRGYNPEKQRWDEAVATAYPARGADEGFLRVSFFWPFYAAYVVFEIDEDYQYAFVTSSSRDYLWLLARKPHVDPELRERFIERAGALGFDVEALHFVKQLQQ